MLYSVFRFALSMLLLIIFILFFLQLKNAGSNILFAAVTEVSDSVLKGAESSGFSGMVITAFSVSLEFVFSLLR